MSIFDKRRAIMPALMLGATFAVAGCATVPDDLFSDIGSGTPTPTPTPSSTASIGSVEQPTLGANPPPAVSPDDLVDLEEATTDQTLTLRLMQSARIISTGSVTTTESDAATDAGGATIAVTYPVDPDAEITTRFSLGNAALGVENVTLEDDPSGAFAQATLGDGRIVTVALAAEDKSTTGGDLDFEWTAYGSWGIRSASNMPQNGSPIVTGIETPDSAIPTSGTATFNGFVEGNVAVPDGTNVNIATLKGDASITADFAAGTLSGAAPSITAIPLGPLPIGSPVMPGPSQQWNGLTFSGTFASGMNGFTGTTGVSSAPGNSYSLLGSATGFLAGRFYGPDADELGAVWNLHDGAAMASGILVGRQ